MGTRLDAHARPQTGKLSTAMRWTLAAVGAVVVAGVVATLMLFFAPATTPQAATPSTSTTAGPAPNATPVDGSEVQPPADQSAPSDRLPPLPVAVPLVTAPLPATSSARGELVTGFPIAVAGPAPGADVIESSVSSSGTVMQIALTARTDATPEDVTAHYRSLWAGLGLSDAGGEDALAYASPFSSITLAFTDGSGTGTVYAVYATLRTE